MTEDFLPERAWFTPLLNRIADVAGERAALLLGREKAGAQIYIPKSVDADHWLTKLIGLEAAEKLCAAYQDNTLLIPPALAGDKRRRARAIAELADKGYSIGKIVQMTGLSRSTVAEHVQRRRAATESAQGRLF